jgi:hypothetical protein
MKSRPLQPYHHGWIESILDEEQVDFLWERIEKSEDDVKDKLAGNISSSREITDDGDGYFLNQVLLPHVEMYRNMNSGMDPLPVPVNEEIELYIHDLWVNHQYQTEFNPYHFHGGMYSFVIWMKIPTDWREQNQLPFLDGMREEDKKPSIFEFQYLDMLGNIKHYGYRLDKSMEGHMLFFPARLMHTVYPFYNCDEDRISVAGNLWYRRTQQ